MLKNSKTALNQGQPGKDLLLNTLREIANILFYFSNTLDGSKKCMTKNPNEA